MASLVFKKSRGHSYAYWVRSARVNGKPRIVEQVYLGTKDRFLEELKNHFTRGTTPGHATILIQMTSDQPIFSIDFQLFSSF